MFDDSPPKWETPARPVRQSDGSLILERKPDPTAKAPAEIPKGAHLERIEKVVLQPKPTPVEHGRSLNLDGDNPAAICPAAEVDLSLLRMPDRTQRVVAFTPHGTITEGLDIPVAPEPQTPRIPRWSVSALRSYDMARAKRAWGAAISYSRGPFVGMAGAAGTTTFVGFGVRF